MNQQFRVILFNKPFNVLCQFRAEQANLSDYIQSADFYCAGRLDLDSEGLLLLTNHGKLQHLISHPKHKLEKTYWVQVEGEPKAEELRRLAAGILLNDGPTKACQVNSIDEPDIWPRIPPIRYRKNKPTSWLEITIHEGRNRQVRRMTAAIGYPTLRLIRSQIGPFQLQGLQPGQQRELTLSLSQLPRQWQRYLLQSDPVSRDGPPQPRRPRNTVKKAKKHQ